MITDLMSRTCSDLAQQMVKKTEAFIAEIFLRETGEELTVDNAHRVTIVPLGRDCPLSSSIFTTHKDLYLIDGVPAIMMYPLDVDLAGTCPFAIKAAVKYEDIAQKIRESIALENIKAHSEGPPSNESFVYLTPIIYS